MFAALGVRVVASAEGKKVILSARRLRAWALTLVHEPASVPPLAFVRYLPALQAEHAAAPLAEKYPLAHCNQPSLSTAFPQRHQHVACSIHTRMQELLTLVHDAASVPPDALVRYLPALQAVHTDAPLAENHPTGHCRHITYVSTSMS